MDDPARATLADVAREAEVHPSTVSRALNPATRHMVTDAVAERVAAAAKRLGYRPNAPAAALRTGRSRIVAVLVPDLLNPVFPPILRAIEGRLAEAGYVTLIGDTRADDERERLLVERMAAQRIDGLVLASAARGAPAVALCARLGIPAVLVNRRQPAGAVPAISAVSNDDVAGIGLAVAHLAALGHRRIAHLAGPVGTSTGADRRRGFRAAMRAAGLDPAAVPVVAAAAYAREAGREAAARLLEAVPRPTAIACANDLLALGAFDGLEAAGLRVPRDVSVTGFNDMPFVDRVAPPLTTVRIQHAAMGMEAAELLLGEMREPGCARREVRLRPLLVARASTAPPD
jgi:LacI family transcriptional regulator